MDCSLAFICESVCVTHCLEAVLAVLVGRLVLNEILIPPLTRTTEQKSRVSDGIKHAVTGAVS